MKQMNKGNKIKLQKSELGACQNLFCAPEGKKVRAENVI